MLKPLITKWLVGPKSKTELLLFICVRGPPSEWQDWDVVHPGFHGADGGQLLPGAIGKQQHGPQEGLPAHAVRRTVALNGNVIPE